MWHAVLLDFPKWQGLVHCVGHRQALPQCVVVVSSRPKVFHSIRVVWSALTGAKWSSKKHLKKPVESQWNQSFSMVLYVSPSLQFCNQSTELRNGSLEAKAGAGPM